MTDQMGRAIEYVRVSVTDRCNLRCQYCMPAQGAPALKRADILRFEEIAAVVRALAALGVKKVKLTGGEPLCRKGLPALVRMLYAVDGIEEVTLTTNGLLLPGQAAALGATGIERVNISVDSLRPARYARITRTGRLEEAVAGMEAAEKHGMRVKINMVPMRGINDDEILDFIRFGRQSGRVIRFIELMPVGLGDAARGVSKDELLATIEAAFPGFAPFAGKLGNGPADCYGWPEGGVFGVIGAVHNCFCARCNRVRLTADGNLRLCLGQKDALDLKPYLREGAGEMTRALRRAIYHKPAGHAFSTHGTEDRIMNQIGG